jgi:predicted DCC family thiol-disulfide oxidoreductase YuxK
MPALPPRSLFLLLVALLLVSSMRAFVYRAGPATWTRRAATTTSKISTARFSTASSSSAGAGADATTATPLPPKPTMDEALATFNKVFPTGTASADLRPVVLFDGVCMFCNRGIDTLLALDINRKIRVAPLQSELGRSLMTECGRDPDDLSSMLVVEADKRLSLKSDAAIRIAEVAAPHTLLGGALEKAAKMLLPQGFRDDAYDQVAENRYSIMGKRDECRLPDPGDDRFIA